MCDVTHIKTITKTIGVLTCHSRGAYKSLVPIRHDSFLRVTWRIDTCDMTHPYMWHYVSIHVTWLIYTCDITKLYTCDMTHAYMWHCVSIRVTWLIYTCDITKLYTCDMTHLYMRHHLFIRATWLIYTCNMTHVTNTIETLGVEGSLVTRSFEDSISEARECDRSCLHLPVEVSLCV